MTFKQREKLDDIIMHMRSGRMKRRTFLERAVALGLSLSAASSLLESCSTIGVHCTPNGWVNRPNTIVWNSEHDDQSDFSRLIATFNSKHPDAHVIYNNSPFKEGAQYQDTVSAFQTCNSEMDVISIDMIWLAEFAKEGWILPLTDAIGSMVQKKYGAYQSVIDSCTYKGRKYSAPLRFDLGMLFYNTAFVASAPRTWDELVESVDSVRIDYPEVNLDGYVWQGKRYEGLVCHFIEVLGGYGGSLLDPRDPTKVTVNTPEARAALNEMLSWIWSSRITPRDVITTRMMSIGGKEFWDGYEEADARVRWQSGYAVYMRNWFNVASLVMDPTISAVSTNVAYSAIPHSIAQSTGHSCTGGWHLGVNAASANQDLCWQLIDFILNNARDYTPADIFADPSLQILLSQAVVRPQLPTYTKFSERIQARISDALATKVDPASALANLQSDLQSVIAES